MTLFWLLISAGIDWFSVEQLEDFKHEQNVKGSNGFFPLFLHCCFFLSIFPSIALWSWGCVLQHPSSMPNEFVPWQVEAAQIDSFGQV